MIVTRLDSHGNAEIPSEVSTALGLKPGDRIGFRVEADQVILYRHADDDEMDEETGMTIGQLRALVAEAFDDPADSIPAEQAFAELRAYAAAKRAAAE